MLYEKALLDKWTEYAVKKTAEEKIRTAEEKASTAMKEGLEKGMQKGIEKGKEQFVKNLISKFGFTDEQAASAAEVSTNFVKRIRTSLKKRK